MSEANLLVTFEPSHRARAMQEIKLLLDEVDEKAEFLDSDYDGVFLIRVGDPRYAVKRLRSLCESDAGKFRYTHKWSPIERWVSSDIEEIKEEMSKINEMLSDDDKWRLDIAKRRYDMNTVDLIKALTENIDRPKVDLKHPDKIVKVEILGDKAGIALLDREELLQVDQIKK